MTLSRMINTVEEDRTPDQTGFCPARSCCSHVLYFTQYIDDELENKQIIGAFFVDLAAACDTVNHRSLLLKVTRTIRNTTLVRITVLLLHNRGFFFEMDGKKSGGKRQKNGLPQRSVLAPILFNIYTNGLSEFPHIC